MNQDTKTIMALLNIDAETAIIVQNNMQISFSNCTMAQFKREAKSTYEDFLAGYFN
jgi:hypothetical protein